MPAQTDRVGPDGLLAPVQDTMWYLCSKLGTSIHHSSERMQCQEFCEHTEKLSSHSLVPLKLFEYYFQYTQVYIFTFTHTVQEVEGLEN